MSIAHPEFEATRCVRYRFRYSGCTRCVDACPHQSIDLEDSGASLLVERCQNCALCISACHTGAWSASAYKPIDLLRLAIKAEQFSVACAPSGMAADAVVPCLGSLDACTLAFLEKRLQPISLHGTAHCPECAHAPKGEEQLAANLEALAELRRAAAPEVWRETRIADDSVAATPPNGPRFAAGRRQLFRRLIGRGVDEIISAAEPQASPRPAPDQAIRAGAYALTEQRELLRIVAARKDGQPFRVAIHEALPALDLRIKPGCTLCEACFRVCPTGAIRIIESSGDWAIVFQRDRCVGCAVCLEVCQPRVLNATAQFDLTPDQPARPLISRAKQRCDRCDRFFVSPRTEETCPVCRDDQDAFSAVFG
ncbi:MAG: 4Fe-4S dicluster domain-containing protein [Rhodocyclaceae bacterium]|nr:MAG: 4Fe-4S dicluster domain-containing protein [Rhodocyclaceae bacterium]